MRHILPGRSRVRPVTGDRMRALVLAGLVTAAASLAAPEVCAQGPDAGTTLSEPTERGGGSGLPLWFVVLMGGGGVATVVTMVVVNAKSKGSGSTFRGSLAGGFHKLLDHDQRGQPRVRKVGAGAVQIAIDGRARSFVRARRPRAAEASDWDHLRATYDFVSRMRGAWRWARVAGYSELPPSRAKSKYGELDERFAIDHGEEEGDDGYVVVTFVAAGCRDFWEYETCSHADDVQEMLNAIGTLSTNDYAASKVGWRLGVAKSQLASLDPPPDRLENGVPAARFCHACGCPHPPARVECPICSASQDQAE